MLSNLTVQCVHLYNIEFNCDSAGLILHSWVEETEVFTWMKKIVYLFQILFKFLIHFINLDF